jgi:hypothetical protein
MLAEFWSWLETLPLAMRIGETWWFPLLESLHVVAVVLVVGSILMVDLRLLGVAARTYAVSRLSSDLVPWTWGAFAVAAITGLGLFMTRASHYVGNTAFQFKIALLLLAGVNTWVLHKGVFKSVAQWDQSATPALARVAAIVSLLSWIGVVLAGRWTGHLS